MRIVFSISSVLSPPRTSSIWVGSIVCNFLSWRRVRVLGVVVEMLMRMVLMWCVCVILVMVLRSVSSLSEMIWQPVVVFMSVFMCSLSMWYSSGNVV